MKDAIQIALFPSDIESKFETLKTKLEKYFMVKQDKCRIY